VIEAIRGIFETLDKLPDAVANGFACIWSRLSENRCPHCFGLFYKWRVHPCPVVDTETKRYPRYLYEEVWNLEGYDEAYPREGIEAMLENAREMIRLGGIRVEDAMKGYIERRMKK
jgi:hypothetical protein